MTGAPVVSGLSVA